MIESLPVIFVLIFSSGCLADGITKEVKVEPDSSNGTDHKDMPYCFRFTWLGLKYDEDTNIKNVTCDDLTKGEKGTPCRKPLVATNNSSIPDTDWMWKTYKNTPTKIACRMTSVDVCVKYTYKYNHAVENITYMCSKVRIDGEDTIDHGCYSQHINGRDIEVCVCKSRPGRMPCNAGSIFQWNILAVIISAAIAFSWMTLIENS